MYIGDGSSAIDIAWNQISDNHGNRGIQVFTSTPGGAGDIFDIHAHDNLIFNNRGAGIIFTHVNADKGPVEAYNNVIHDAGIGPDFADGTTAWECFQSANNGVSSTISVYNNTMYNCGFTGGGAPGGTGIEVFDNAILRNNIVDQPSSFSYLTLSGGTPSCSNNLFFGSGATPSSCATGAVNVDPLFSGLSLLDFHLTALSPAKDAGVTIASLKMDRDGVSRPQGPAYDIGAYEFFAGGSTVQPPNPPTNLSVTVQ
jgi:hypothetical protein